MFSTSKRMTMYQTVLMPRTPFKKILVVCIAHLNLPILIGTRTGGGWIVQSCSRKKLVLSYRKAAAMCLPGLDSKHCQAGAHLGFGEADLGLGTKGRVRAPGRPILPASLPLA